MYLSMHKTPNQP